MCSADDSANPDDIEPTRHTTLSEAASRPLVGSIRNAASVFISSRTDELWPERNAVAMACDHAGYSPLLFDAALNRLVDEVSVQQAESKRRYLRGGGEAVTGERHSGKRELRMQVDGLIDRADLFIGVYHRTLGGQDYSIGWLTWVQYEFYRFLFRWVDFEGGGGFVPGIEKQLNRRLRSFEEVRRLEVDLQRAVLGDPADRPRRIRGILESRVLMFVKRAPDSGFAQSADLGNFVSKLGRYVREFRTTVREAPLDGGLGGDYHYFPAHAALFRSVLACLAGGRAERGSAAASDADRARRGLNHFRVFISSKLLQDDSGEPDVAGHLRHGVLHRILRVLFRRGLTVDVLYVGCDESRFIEHGITFIVSDRHLSCESGLTGEELESLLLSELGEERYACAASSVDPKDVLSAISFDGLDLTDMKVPRLRRIEILDRPGALWSVVALAAAYQGVISFAHLRATDRDPHGAEHEVERVRGALYVDIEFPENPEADSGRSPIALDVETFDYQLRTMYCVASVSYVGVSK